MTMRIKFLLTAKAALIVACSGFTSTTSTVRTASRAKGLVPRPSKQSPSLETADEAVQQASQVLQEWDRLFNPESSESATKSMEDLFEDLEPSVRLLNQKATEMRQKDSTTGRVMLGICASSAVEGVETLKSWVTNLELPRGLLHGMDKDGVPIELDGAVYIKYNSGGVYTFADIRKSGLGFDALWKPGDALIERYTDGNYRGVYFQVELADEEFRQYLVPLDLFQM